jgi:Zn-dependent oligopeptidase
MKFQNILEDESTFTIDLKESDLIGLPDSVIATAKETAVERKKADGE